MFIAAISIISLFIIIMGLKQLFSSLEFEYRIFSFPLFVSILMVYTIILIGFGIIYLTLDQQGITVYKEALHMERLDWVNEMVRSMYFSGVTLFTVGYGDMVPVGVGRWIAIIEAMFGYSLPAALVVKVWQNYNEER